MSKKQEKKEMEKCKPISRDTCVSGNLFAQCKYIKYYAYNYKNITIIVHNMCHLKIAVK